jgi:hypothetical protein
MSDFFLTPYVASQVVDNPTVASYQNVLRVAQSTLPWLPNLMMESSAAFYGTPPKIPRLNSFPSGLTSDQQQAWTQVKNAINPIEVAMMQGAMAQAKAQGDQLAANTTFWNNVYRATAAVATVGMTEAWALLVSKLQQIRDARAAGDAGIQAMKATLQTLPPGPGAQRLANAINTAISQRSSLEGSLASALGPLGVFASNAKADAGLSDFPVGMAIAAVMVATIAGVVGTLVYRYISWQQQITANQNSLTQAAVADIQQGVADKSITPQKGAELITNVVHQMTATKTGWATMAAIVLALGGVGYWLATRKKSSGPTVIKA